MNFEIVKEHFEFNIQKKTLSELSIDKISNESLIKSSVESFDYDTINYSIKTTDTLFFINSNIIFVEFKKGESIKDIDLRLKATESILSFLNYIIGQKLTEFVCFPNDVFQLYFVYDRNNINATQVTHLSNIERKLQKEYCNILSKYRILPQDSFKKIFKI